MRLVAARAAALLLLLSAFYCAGEEQVKKLSGTEVTFTANVTGPPSEINWFKDERKIVDLESGKSPHFYDLRERLDVDLERRTFTLRNLTPSDSGLYKAEAVVKEVYENTFYKLQVFDHVCAAVIIPKDTTKDNVTLSCTCSPGGAVPIKYEWRNGSDEYEESGKQQITVKRMKIVQNFTCIVSNEVSYSRTTFGVPAKEELEPASRVHIYILVAIVMIVILGALTAIGLRVLKKCNVLGAKRTMDVEDQRENHVTPGARSAKHEDHKNSENVCLIPPSQEETESLPPLGHVKFPLVKEKASIISIKKDAENSLMTVTLHAALCLEKLRVQRERLKIMDVEEGDCGEYTAEVYSQSKADTFTFWACESAQNGEAGAHDDPPDRVFPVNGTLNLQIPNALEAKEIIWKKDGTELLTVACGSDPLLQRLALERGALCMDLLSGDGGTFWAEVTPPGQSAARYKFDVNVRGDGKRTEIELKRGKPTKDNDAPLGFGEVTLCPASVRAAEKITWKKDGNLFVEWEARKNPQYLTKDEVSLDPRSGHLTFKNIQESDNGIYIVEAYGDKTTAQTFSLNIQLETAV